MYLDKRRKGQTWARSGRYGSEGKRKDRNAARLVASVIGWNIERMLGIR
jgi:hypothetical protein